MGKQTEVVIKTGAKPITSFLNCKNTRVITGRELGVLLESRKANNKTPELVVLEYVTQEEDFDIAGMLFTTDCDFIVVSNDEYTLGFADENRLVAFDDDDKAYEYISKKLGYNVNKSQRAIREFIKKQLESSDISKLLTVDIFSDSDIENKVQSEKEEVKDEDELNFSIESDNFEEKSSTVEVTDDGADDKHKDTVVDEKIGVDESLNNEKINKLVNYISAVTQKMKDMEQRYNKFIESESIVYDNPISVEKAKEISGDIVKYKEEVQKLKEEVAETSIELEKCYEELDSCKSTNKQLAERVDRYKQRVSELELVVEENAEIANKLAMAADENERLTSQVSNYSKLVVQNMTEIDEKSNELDESIKHIEILKKSLEVVSKEVYRLQLTVASSAIGNAEVLKEVEELKARAAEITEYQNETERLKIENGRLNKKLSELKEELETVDKSSSSSKEVEAMMAKVTSLKSQKDEMAKLVDSAELKLAIKDKQMDSLKADNIKYEEALIEMKKLLESKKQHTTNVGCTSAKEFKYNGRATLIPVFGIGSHGISSVAYSMADKFFNDGQSVLLVDFDFQSPKLDAFTKKNPLCKSASGYSQEEEIEFTSTALLFKRGARYLKDNSRECVLNIKTNNQCRLSLFSGCYVNVTDNELASTDIGGILTYIGNSYDKIIIDFGKLKARKVIDEIITNVIKSVNIGIAVAANDSMDIRNIVLAVEEFDIEANKLLWLLNMSPDSVVQAKTKEMIGSKYELIPFDSALLGSKKSLMNSSTTKSKFESFLTRLSI